MPIIFAEEEAGYASLTEAKEVLAERMALYNTINAAVFDDAAALPPDCVFRDDILATLAIARPWRSGPAAFSVATSGSKNFGMLTFRRDSTSSSARRCWP